MRLNDEVALVTGGGRGIGRAIALKFAQEGAHLVVVGRAVSSLEEVASEIRTLGRQALVLPCDVSDDGAVREMVRQAEARFGRIDILVNNAGYFTTNAPLHEMPDSEWDQTLRMNLTSVFYVCRAALPGMMARRRGSIIMMSSIAARAAFPFSAPYAVTKAGLLGLTRSLAAEAGPYGIRVNALCPGVVLGTEMHHKVNREIEKMSGIGPEKRLEAARNSLLLRRLPTAEDVAATALFLASADSSIMTGQALNVDGGSRLD